MRAFRILNTVLVLLTTLAAVQGAIPRQVRFIGNKLEKKITGRIDRLISRGTVDSVGIFLSDQGYLDYRLEQSGDTLIINPGPLFRMGNINLKVIGVGSDIEKQAITGYREADATKKNVVALKEDILWPYQQEGYYFASLNTESVNLAHDEISPGFKLITGPVVEIQRIRFKGLRKSKPEFVQRLSGLRKGDPFVEGRYRTAIRALEAGDYLQNDSMPLITPNESYDGVELLFYLSELKSNRLELGGGYLPGRATEKGEFVGRLRYESKNLFGSGRRINLFLDRKDRSSSRVEFRFGQPFFVPDHMELILHFSQVDYDSSYYSFTIDGSLNLITRGNTRIGGGLSWTKTEPQRSSQPPSRRLSGLVQYEVNRLDYRPNPSTGRHLEITLSYIRRSSWPDSVASTIIDNESMFEIAADNFFRLGRGFVFRLNLESSVLITPRELIDFSEQFKLGGFQSLRGYRQEQFSGRRTFLGQAELRLRPTRLLAVYLFSDMGYVYRRREVEPSVIKSEDLSRWGSGFGIFVGGSTARMTMEIGWGRHDRVDEGKVHFGLVTLF